MMHVSPPSLIGDEKIKNPRWWTAAILKSEKLCYLQNLLADFDEILHGDVYWPPGP